jgi:hypothetical protein
MTMRTTTPIASRRALQFDGGMSRTSIFHITQEILASQV